MLDLISMAGHQRGLHLEWVGTILPIEHAWWATHAPPNGRTRQCRVRQISDYEARQRGYGPKDLEVQGHLRRGGIAMPVAVLPRPLVEALGAETSVVRLSVVGASRATRAWLDR